MAVLVVDDFEMIQIKHQHGQFTAVTADARKFLFRMFEKVPAASAACEKIGIGLCSS